MFSLPVADAITCSYIRLLPKVRPRPEHRFPAEKAAYRRPRKGQHRHGREKEVPVRQQGAGRKKGEHNSRYRTPVLLPSPINGIPTHSTPSAHRIPQDAPGTGIKSTTSGQTSQGRTMLSFIRLYTVCNNNCFVIWFWLLQPPLLFSVRGSTFRRLSVRQRRG